MSGYFRPIRADAFASAKPREIFATMPGMASTAFVAGASSGIGAAIAEALLDAGWQVALSARRSAPLAALAARAPRQVLALPADLTDAAAVEALAARLRAWQPRLSALVTAAGDFFQRSLAETTPAEFERLWRVNVLSKFLLMRELAPLLEPASAAQPPSAVIHVASLAVHQDFPDESAYAAAMYAVEGMARSQDLELAPRGIRVAVLSPGLTRTELTERSFPPPALRGALPPAAMAVSALHLISTIRAGGYIAEILHLPGRGRLSAEERQD